MAVEEQEPLTKPLSEGGSSTHQKENVVRSGGERLNALLSSALHKHASRKLGEKLSRHKNEPDGDQEVDGLEDKEKKKKKKKVKVRKKKDIQDDVELEDYTSVKDEKKKKKKKINRKKNEADLEEEDRKKECQEQEHESKPDEDAAESVPNVEDDKEENDDIADVTVDSPTREYLKAVSVPKRKTGNRSCRSTNYTDTGGVLGITVHCADRLEGSPLVYPHPVVQVHICNLDTGEWLRKSSTNRKVTSFYEGSDLDYILPVMTQPYILKMARSLCCRWEEQLMYNEGRKHFISDDPQVIIFFQLMDFAFSATGSNMPRSQVQNSVKHGWSTIAWAFLKIRGANNHLNFGHRMRLQLWRPRRSSGVTLRELHSWWRSGSRNKYPATLYVSVEEVMMQKNPRPALRSMFATQEEQGGGGINVDLEQSSVDGSAHSTTNNIHKGVNWSRKPNQSCKVPNYVKYRLPNTDQGCLVVKFSCDGLRLACGTPRQILLYDVLTGDMEVALSGHLGLIYDISWGNGDQNLLTASADATARVWNVASGEGFGSSQALIHPSYVYVARFIPGRCKYVVSGCYDHVIRVWSCDKSGTYVILQELANHLSFVNALCFDPEGTTMFSGDKQGFIFAWKVDIPKKVSTKRKVNILNLDHEAKIKDVVGNIINSISYHPSGFRLLIHTRDSQVRLVNHKHWTVTHRLRGLVNVREQVRGCFSPCGTWVVSGSEDRGVYSWHSDTGEMTSALMDLPIEGTTSCVDFHPHDNMMAISSYSSHSTVLILSYNQESSSSNTTVPLAVQPAASTSFHKTFARSPSPSYVNFSESPQNKMFIGTMAINDMSSSLRDNIDGEERRQPLTRSEMHDEPRVSSSRDIQGGNETEAASLCRKRLSKDHGTDILLKLDTLLKMAGEDPLSISTESTREKIEGHVVSRGRLATVLYDYHSSGPNELTVKEGDFVMVVEETNSDWWMVRTADQRYCGLLPSSYLSYLSEHTTHDQPPAHSSEEGKVIVVPSSSGDVSFISDVEGTPSRARARRHRNRALANQAHPVTSTPKSK